MATGPTGLQRAAGDPFLEEFFARIPRDVAVSFSDEQLMAIRMAFAARHRGAHAIDLRLSIPMPRPVRRIYVVLLAGSERRSRLRRQQDRAGTPLATAGNILFGLFFFALLATAAAGFLYGLKSLLGIDLFPDMSLGLWDDIVDQFRWMAR